MPELPSGLVLYISRKWIPAPEEANFPCFPPPPGYFYYWAPDPEINTPPFQPGISIIRQLETAPVPTTRKEVMRFIQVLIGLEGANYYWRGDWLSDFPKPRELNDADQKAWEEWLTTVEDFLDETIDICRRQAEALQVNGVQPAAKINPLRGLTSDLLEALSPLANLTGGTPAFVRLALAGARFNLETLGQDNLKLIYAVPHYQVGDIPLDVGNNFGLGRLEARCWFSKTGHLHDVQFLGYPQTGKDVRIFLEDAEDRTRALVDILKSAQVEPYPATFEEDWEILRMNQRLQEGACSLPPELQTAAILEIVLGELKKTDPHMAARYVTSVLRFVHNWPDTELLARMAEHAAVAGLKHEAAYLAIETLKRPDLSGVAWNLLGCICHHLLLPQEALRCFLQASRLVPNEKTIRANVLLEVDPVFRRLLKERQLVLAAGWAEAVLDSGAVEKREDQAFLHGIIALCCEFFGDVSRARSAWERAGGSVEEFRPSSAGLRRLTWQDQSARRRALEAQLDTYPQLPEETDQGGRIPIHYTEGDTHGSHWETVVPDLEDFFAQRLEHMITEGRLQESKEYCAEEQPH